MSSGFAGGPTAIRLWRAATRSSRLIVLIAIVMMLAASSLVAQTGAGFGSITGVVQDSSGAVIAGAKVIVANPAKGIQRTLETNGAGLFNAPSLVPASGYVVTITKEGFAGNSITDITVEVGSTVSLNPTMKVAGSAQSVEVTAAAPIVDTTKVDTSAVVDSRQILDLPINGRRVDSFVLLQPGVTNDAAFGLLTFRGNPGGNSFLTDGNDTTNSFYDENAGRTRSYNIAQDAVQEFQVVSSNFLAEYGRASGGVVNTVTRSGTNSFHGTAYEFFRNATLAAKDRTAFGINPPEWRHQAGVSLGGPIVKDKLFFFWNGELMRRNNPLVSSNLIGSTMFDANGNYLVTNPTTLKPNCPTTVTVGTGTPTQAQCNAAIAYLKSRVAPQLLPRKVDNNLLFGKIDYHVNDRHSLSFSTNYLDWRSPNGIQTQLSLTNGDGIGNNADSNVFDRTARASWTWIVTPNSVNEFRYGYFKDRQFDPASPSLLPSVGPIALTVQSSSNVGYANGYPRLNPSEQRHQLSDTLTWTTGKHNLKFGLDWDHVEDYVNRLANQFGTYSYATLANYAMDFTGNTGATNNKHWTSFSQVFGNAIIDVQMPEIAWFAQDQWRVTPKLTISPGLRFDYTWIPQPTKVCNPAQPLTCQIPNSGVNVAPRLGIAYAITPKMTVRAGYGIFYNRYTTSAIENAFITNGVYQASYSLSSNNATQFAAGPIFPNRLAAAPGVVTGSSSILYIDPKWKNPYSEQANLAIEREIAKNTSMTVSYVWSRGLHIQGTRDANLGAPTTSYTYPILDASGAVVSNYTTGIYTTASKINPALSGLWDVVSNSNSYYNGLLVNLSRRYSSWLQGNVAYTYSHAIDYGVGGAGTNILFGSTFPTSYNNGDFRGEKGSANNDRRHNLVVNAMLSPRLMRGDSAFARYVANGWQLGVVEFAASSQVTSPTITVQDRVTGVLSSSTINGLGGSFRVPFEGIDYLKIGPLVKTDARLTKQFPIGERVKLNLGFEAFNLLNHLVVSGGTPRVTRQYTTINQTAGPAAGKVALVPFASFGQIQQTQYPPDGTTARRAQAYVRITW